MEVEYDSKEHLKLNEASELMGMNRLELERIITSYGNGIHLQNYKGIDLFLEKFELGRVLHRYSADNGTYQKDEKDKGIKIERYFTDGKTDPFDTVGEYKKGHIEIRDLRTGKIKFEIDAEFPISWKETSRQVAASKYFFKPKKEDWIKKIAGGYEHSPKQLFSRVSKFFADWGLKLGYFQTEEERNVFEDELNFLQINQMAAFNSPVYFNAGLWDMYGVSGSKGVRYARDPETGEVSRVEEGCYTRPQTHACFIKGPKDNLESLLHQVDVEGSIFADGSGIGHDLSNIRAEDEPISGGGRASGPMAFFKGYDFWGGVIKSGGKTRRAARMTTMRYWHPDIMDFIRTKVKEDHKALTLIKAGYGSGMDGEAYKTVAYQSTNLSVRVDDYFFEQVEKDGKVQLKYIKSGEIAKEISARRMLQEIAFGSWRIGDPSLQYETKIQEMNTAKNSGMINSSNPCSEYKFLDDTSCNLNSLNLIKFSDESGNFKSEAFRKAIRIMTISADIANDAGSYPDSDIAKISPEFRTIGVGYANLGALLMRKGLPYDSPEGRAIAAAITAVMHAEVYKTSAELAKGLEPFVHFELNKGPMLEVMRKHRNSVENIGNWVEVYGDNFNIMSVNGLEELIKTARQTFDDSIGLGEKYGYRNAQATVIAPTGTIARLMGCDTTGVEPSEGLIITKNLAGGGNLKLVVEEVPNALKNLGYKQNDIEDILRYLENNKTMEEAPHLRLDHYNVFDTAFSPMETGRTIDFQGHIKMIGATQPFISGAISKTNNLPEKATVKDIYNGYLLGHELGLKAISAFRYNSKPITTLTFGDEKFGRELKWGEKRELPSERNSFEKEFTIDRTRIHMIVSEYADGTPGQIVFLSHKGGSTLNSSLAIHGISASKSLKHGTPLEDIISGWEGHKFEPGGLVRDDPWIKTALSPLDYAAKVLKLHYLGDLDVADNKEGLDKIKLRGYQTGAFETYEMRKINDWDYEQVINHPKLGGFVNPEENRKLKNEEIKREGNNSGSKGDNIRGVVCTICGNLMSQTGPNCYECNACFTTLGGCGS